MISVDGGFLEEQVELALQFMYRGFYEIGAGQAHRAPEIHNRVYNVALSYDMPALKALAISNFSESLKDSSWDELSICAQKIHLVTRPNDDMQACMAKLAADHLAEVLKSGGSISHLSGLDQFTADIISDMQQKYETLKTGTEARLDVLEAKSKEQRAAITEQRAAIKQTHEELQELQTHNGLSS